MDDAGYNDLAAMRREYETAGLTEADAAADPFTQFDLWFTQADRAGVELPNTMILATVDERGAPSARAVLMKGYGPAGFDFYTNYESRKGAELATNPRAAACLVWQPLHRQVRLEGVVARLSSAASDRYFASRPRGAQVAATASPQSRVIRSRTWLEAQVAARAAHHGAADIPRPPHWGGYRLQPDRVEFWQGRPDRLHDRLVYRALSGSWRLERLAP